MVKKFYSWIAGRCNNLPLSLLVFIILYSGIMLVPTSVSLRDQRAENAAYALFIATGIYIFTKISKSMGLVLLYLGAISFYSFVYAIDAFFLVYSFVAMFLFITLTYSQWKERKNAIYDCIIIIALLNVIMQGFQYFQIFFISYPVAGMETMRCGLMNNINDLSALYAVCLPAFMRKGRWYYIPFVFLGLYLAITLNGMLAAFCVLTLYAILKTKRAAVAFMCIVVAISLLTFFMVKIEKFNWQDHKNGRLYIWKMTYDVARVKYTGWGINQFDKVMPLLTSFKYISPDNRQALYAQINDKRSFDKALQKISNNDVSYFHGNTLSRIYFIQAHSEILEWYFIAGPLGFLIGIGFLLRYLWLGFKQDDRIPFYGLLASCLTACFFFTWHIIPTATITVFYLGLIRGEKCHTQTVKEQ